MRTFNKPKFRAMQCAGSVSLLTLAAGASQASNNVGWVLADQPTNVIYTPNPKYTFNSGGGSVTIERFGAGNYTATFTNLTDSNVSEPFTVLVSAYNTSNRCIAQRDSTSGSSVTVSVQCFSSGRDGLDTPFTLLYQSRSTQFGNAREGVAYLAAAGSEAVINQAFNSSGGTASFSRAKKGSYVVTFTGLAAYSLTPGGLATGGGAFQVTPSSQDIDYIGGEARCKVAEWTGDSTHTQFNVHCYTFDGEPADVLFNFGYAIGESLGVVGGVKARGTWTLANNPTSTKAYAPQLQYNGFRTGRLTAQKTGTGQYTVSIPGTVSYGTSNALVTAYGFGGNYCNIAGWTINAISVSCYNQSGLPADSQFDVSFQTAH